MMTFGQRLKFYRKRAKKTQKDVQAETQIPQSTISGWEIDQTEPCVSDVRKLAAALDVSIAELIEGEDQEAACLPKTG